MQTRSDECTGSNLLSDPRKQANDYEIYQQKDSQRLPGFNLTCFYLLSQCDETLYYDAQNIA